MIDCYNYPQNKKCMSKNLTSSLFYVLLVLIPYSFISNVHAQFINLDRGQSVSVLNYTGLDIGYLPNKDKQNAATAYISPQWNMGSVELESGKLIQNCLMKYNLINNQIEINNINDEGSEIKLVYAGSVKRFYWLDTELSRKLNFVSCKLFKFDQTPIYGFFQIVVYGKYQLFLKTKINLKEADYVSVLNVGSPTRQLEQKESLYFYNKDLVYELKSLKDFFELIPEKSEKLQAYAKENYIKKINTENMAQLVKYLNSLED